MADTMTAKAIIEDGELWTDEMARHALPILLSTAARYRKTITYRQLAEELTRLTGMPAHHRQIGRVAGKIGHALVQLAEETDADIPPINAIVVNVQTHLPGEGAAYFVKKLLDPAIRRKLSGRDENALAEAAIDAVLTYDNWKAVGRELGVKKLPPVPVLEGGKSESAPIENPAFTSGGGYPESAQHKALKMWVVENPKVFERYGKFGRGKNEEGLDSGDRLDAYLWNDKTRLAVEVKASNAPMSEVFRGIFQCVKYRATLRAMQFADSVVPNADAVLLVGCDVSGEAERLAKRLHVAIIKAPKGADNA